MSEMYIDPEKDKIYHVPYVPKRPIVDKVKIIIKDVTNRFITKKSTNK